MGEVRLHARTRRAAGNLRGGEALSRPPERQRRLARCSQLSAPMLLARCRHACPFVFAFTSVVIATRIASGGGVRRSLRPPGSYQQLWMVAAYLDGPAETEKIAQRGKVR